jgi:hypothetical protein
MDWHPAADSAAQEAITQQARNLEIEAERVAQRHNASEVSKEYVQQAAAYLNVGKVSSVTADLLLTFGTLFLGAALGVGSSWATASPHPKYPDWVNASAIGCACLGFLLIGFGVAFKMRDR